jgi:hypothetical protein
MEALQVIGIPLVAFGFVALVILYAGDFVQKRQNQQQSFGGLIPA